MKNNPKILYISHTSEMHGSGKAIINIIEQLIGKGCDIFVVLPKETGSLFKQIKEHKINYKVLHVVRWIWPRLETIDDYILLLYRLIKLTIKSAVFYNQLITTIKVIRPDIIHTNVGIVHLGHYVSILLKIPHVWHIREYQDLYYGFHPFPSKNRFLKILSHRNNFPVAITKGIYEHYNLQLNKNAQVIYDGVFSTHSVPKIVYTKSDYFLFVGLVSVGKGIEEAIWAFIEIAEKYPKFELWIAGAGNINYINKLKQIYNDVKYTNRIKFLGHRADVYQLMTKATALIVSSEFEGFGFITAEAMFNGCLVIGRNSAGTKEQFDNGLKMHGHEIGIRYNTRQGLSNTMQMLCSEGILDFSFMINKAQETVMKLYSSNQNANIIYNLYKEILSRNGKQ